MTVTFDDVRAAAVRIAPYAHRTPTMTCEAINHAVGAEIVFKCENLQKVGAFKFRGASNAIFGLAEDIAQLGVGTHSSGNHAQAVALAAQMRGIEAHVVMPSNSPKVKVAAVRGYGASVTFCEPTLVARETTLAGILEATGAQEIHPYNDPRIIAGQGTAALELLEDHPDLQIVMAPVGGGGLLSGTALTTKSVKPSARVVAAEPAGADDAARSLAAGYIIPSVQPNTIADGLLTSLGEEGFPLIQAHVERIAVVDDDAIRRAMRLVWERMKLIIEPSSAVPLAALLEGKVPDIAGTKIGIILSGGNVDLGRLPF